MLFCPPGTLLGWSELHGERYGVTIFTVVTNFNITVLEVPKLQKTIPRKANVLPSCSKSCKNYEYTHDNKIIWY